MRWSRSEALWLTGLSLTATAGAIGMFCAGPHVVLCGGAVAGVYYVTSSLNDWAVGRLYDRGCRLETRLLPWTSTYVSC